MGPAEKLALFASGLLFLNALVTGTWKYAQIRSSTEGIAHPYVDVAHRASLLYSFAALLLSRFAELSPYSATVNLWAVALPLVFFLAAILSYMLHGVLGDTDNQLRKPHVLGSGVIASGTMTAGMAALIACEIGGFLVLFWGFVSSRIL